MRIVEESYLKRTISKLNKYALQHTNYADFFDGLDELEIQPLQDLSFRSDLKYFDELNFIFTVVSSIIAHPHISNTGEHIIVRTELANSISSETFRMTMKDPTLWKDQGGNMVPEFLYYYQNIDELCIYENVFIVSLIKMIESELIKYNDFYVSLIETFEGQEQLSLAGNNVNIAFNKIKRLTKKLKYIKNTRFFKEINRRSKPLKTVHPTNILLKDRLYNYCFKFYRSMIAYSDKKALMQDFRIYHYVLLMRTLKNHGFKVSDRSIELTRDAYGEVWLPKLEFSGKGFDVVVEPYEAFGLTVTVLNKYIRSLKSRGSKHLLLFETQNDEENARTVSDSIKRTFMTVEAMYLWHLVQLDDGVRVTFKNPLSEQALMDKWFEDKLLQSEASVKIYKDYCPSCKKQTVVRGRNSHYRCETCKSIFAFYRDGEKKNRLWFLKLRREK